MKAIIQRVSATMHGNEGNIEIAIDEFGPRMTFTSSPTKVGEKIITSYLTSDDAQCADSYIATSVNLKKLWNDAHDTNYVFEAGIDMNWDGTFHDKLFKDITKAQAYAKSLQESDGEWGEIYVRAIQLH